MNETTDNQDEEILTCKQCTYTWLSRPGKKPETWRPKECPNCKSRKWN